MVYLSLGIVLVGMAAALCAVLLVVMARQLLVPPRMTDHKAIYLLKRYSPEDLGLPFQAMDFVVWDVAAEPIGNTIRIAGWWIPAAIPSSRTVILLHGYSDAKVGGIAWAPVWRSLGWNVLAIDLRAHGESEGRYSTGGYFEREDIEQIIDQLRQSKPRQTEDLALFGVSLGAACAAAVAVRREDLFAVVLESPYADFRVAIRAHGQRLAMPLEWGYGIAYRLAERLARVRFSDVRPLELIPGVHCPLLMIHAGQDTFVSPDEIHQLAGAIAKREGGVFSRHIVIDDVQHTMGLLKDPDAYRQTLLDFIRGVDEAVRTPTAWEATSHG